MLSSNKVSQKKTILSSKQPNSVNYTATNHVPYKEMFHELYIWLTVHPMLEVKPKKVEGQMIFIFVQLSRVLCEEFLALYRHLAGLKLPPIFPSPGPPWTFRIYRLHRNLK